MSAAITRLQGLAFAALLAACASSNPKRRELQPVAVVKPPTAAVSPAPAEAAALAPPEKPAQPELAQADRAEPKPGDASPAQETPPAPGAADPAADAKLAVGRVGDKLLDVRGFLGRLWMRNPSEAREILEHLVFAELALLEAERLGLRVEPAAVDDMIARALAELERKLADAGSKLTPMEHIEKRLGVDFQFYESQLRHDAIVQLLAERAVRGYVLENPRVRVRVMDLPDEQTLALVKGKLDAGGDFEALAREHGLEEARAQGGAVLVLVRSEDHPLARLAFATPVGSVAGPVAEGGRFLLLRPEERLEPLNGTPSSVRLEVEASLARERVDDLEYVQWRAAMVRRYQVDLSAFMKLVGATTP